MPSKQSKTGQPNTAPRERVPLQQSNDDDVSEDTDCLNEAQPICIASEWNQTYEEPQAFDPNDGDDQYLFFETCNGEIFAPLLTGYSYCSISEYFDDSRVASPFNGIINFVSYDNLSFSNQLAAIYEFVIQLLHSKDNANEADIIYPWNLIFPQSKETGLPILSTNGLYFVKLFFCGKWRAILIDDKLPMYDEKWLFPKIVESDDLWPQLLSKAILKFLILSKRLSASLCAPLIVQLLTSKVVTMNISQQIATDCDISYKYITDTEENKMDIDEEETWPINVTQIENWSTTKTEDTPNKFIVNEDMNQIQKEAANWAIVHCPDYNAVQNVNDLCANTKIFSNDMTAMIVTADESKEISDTDTIDVILQIDSLDTNLSERVQLFIYDQANNIKKLVQMNQMQDGFVSFIAPVIPKQIYLIEVDHNVSYSVTACWNPQRCNLQIAPRFGDKNIWNSVGYNMMEIALESKSHPISQTFILFNIHITVMNFQCHILFHSVFDDESLSKSLVFYCVNLDDNSMKLIPNLNLSKLTLQQNQNGHSLIAFSRPTQAINRSKYEIKLLYQGEIEQNIIDMESSLDFKIDYIHNYDAIVMKDEIICDKASSGNCVFMFCELNFITNNNEYSDFGKIVEFVDKNTEDIVAKYTSTRSMVYVPQILITNQNPTLWFVVKLDKNNVASNEKQLFKDDSVQCMVKIISNVPVHLFPDNSKQIQFDKIKQSWQVTKGRAENAFEARKKYLQNRANPAPSFAIRETQNKDVIVVNDEFWIKDSEIKDKLVEKSKQNIVSEQQFRADQTTKINDYNAYIETVQKESVKNTQTFTQNDFNQRGELRSERLKWNQILSALDTVDGEMKDKFDHFTQILTKYDEDVKKLIQNAIDSAAEPAKKGKSKSKSKVSKPNTNDVIFPSNITKLIEHCENVEQNLPEWVYGNKISECNARIHAILYNVYQQINAQFSELVQLLKTNQIKENDVFSEFSEKYIDLCAIICEQIKAIKEWKDCAIWSDKLQDAQNRADDIMIDSVFVKLQSIVSKESAMDLCKKQDTEIENENEAIEINVDMVKEYLSAIPFVSESRTEIVIKQRTFALNESYTKYIINIEQWIQQQLLQDVEQ